MTTKILGAFNHFLATARAGERFVYHIGNLGADRARYVFMEPPLPPRLVANPAVDEIGTAAWRAYKAGRVLLVQHRARDKAYEGVAAPMVYLAIKRRSEGVARVR